MDGSTKGYELMIREVSDGIADVTIARHNSLSIENRDGEYHLRGVYTDVLASGLVCLSLDSVMEADAETVLSGDSVWHRHITSSFDRVFDMLVEESVAMFDLNDHLTGAIARQIMVLKREARKRETDLNLAYAMRNTQPNRG